MSKAVIIFGNQLVANHPALTTASDLVIMIEAYDICSKLNYHKHKLILILAAMRSYRDDLIQRGYRVEYIQISDGNIFIEDLDNLLGKLSAAELCWMQATEQTTDQKMINLAKKHQMKHEVYPSKLFLTSDTEFDEWHTKQNKPQMDSFYRYQRTRLNILLEDDQPVGGKWSLDHLNREPLPKAGIVTPELPPVIQGDNVEETKILVSRLFGANPGETENFWLPTTRAQAAHWLDDFVGNRLANFGKYEDAMHPTEPFLFHSVLSPLINIGLIDPMTIVNKTLVAYESGAVPLNSAEGLIRQIIGWREYMYGMYRRSPKLKNSNYFGFTRQLENWWYTSEYEQTDLPIPIKSALRTVHKYGYNHHIERLMILGNWFLLNEYSPQSVYEWFSAMYVDAYEWVMVPNVIGMSQYADGGLIATKPYISGGNYLQKMGSWWPKASDAKDSEFNRLYWRFLYKNKGKLKNNHRMSIALAQAEKQYNKSQ
jgi:deoxyribodipyrimidine photolyase-related protein